MRTERAWGALGPACLLLAAAGGGGCGYARVGPPIDLATDAARLATAPDFDVGHAIVRFRLPPAWVQEWPDLHPIVETARFDDDGKLMYDDLPTPETLFHHPQRTYAGAIYYVYDEGGLNIEAFVRMNLRNGFARNVKDPSLNLTRIDGRGVFVLRGHFDNHSSALTQLGAMRARWGGDVAIAVIHLPNFLRYVVVILVSEPGLLSRDPRPAFEIFGSCRFNEPKKKWDPDGELHG